MDPNCLLVTDLIGNLKHIEKYLPVNLKFLEIGNDEQFNFEYIIEEYKPSYTLGVSDWDYYHSVSDLNTTQDESDKYIIDSDFEEYQRFLAKYENVEIINSDPILSLAFDDEYLEDWGYFNLVYIYSCDEYEKNLSYIRNVILKIKPEVVVINKYSNMYLINNDYDENVFKAIYNSYLIVNQNDYILEVNNTQYVLVRRDCYAKGFAIDKNG